MKVAITSDLYYPMTNGVAVFAHNLAKGLAKQGHEVIVICPSFKGKPYKERRDGVTVHYLRSIRFPFYPDQINEVPNGKEFLGMSLPRIAYRHGLWITVDPYPTLKKILNKFHPDVIHNQTAEMIAIAARRYAKKYDTPMVSTGHAYPDNITSQLKILKPIKRPLDAVLRAYMASFLKHSEYATMPTEMAIDDLVPKNRKRFDVTVEPLSNGVDLAQFVPLAETKTKKVPQRIYRKFRLPMDRPLILYVGRVDPEKSIGNVVSAFAGVLEKVPEAMLVIVGDGTDRRHLEDLVAALGIEKSVRFPGRVYPPDIMDLYRAGKIFVTASETETQGIVLIEAAATGLPLVAVDAGAVRELCQHKKNGILCTPGDVAEMTDALVKLLKNEDVRQRYAEHSLVVARKHDLNSTLQRFVEIYEEAIALKGKKLSKKSWTKTLESRE